MLPQNSVKSKLLNASDNMINDVIHNQENTCSAVLPDDNIKVNVIYSGMKPKTAALSFLKGDHHGSK